MISTDKCHKLHVVAELQQESLVAREETEVIYSSVNLFFFCVYSLGVQEIHLLNGC